MLTLDKKNLRNIGWQGFGSTAAQVINVISLPIITRLYLPGDLGSLKVFLEVLAFISIVISFKVEHIIMLPKTERGARALFLFVFSLGVISSSMITLLVVVLFVLEMIPKNIFVWALILPITAFLMVFSRAVQQISQRSGDFRISGISEIVNRFSNSAVACLSGVFSLPGVALALAVAIGFSLKIITFFTFLKYLGANLLTSFRIGFRRLKKGGHGKILGSLVFSQIALSVTTLTPFWYISSKWGVDYLGYFSLVLSTLVLPTTLIGRAVGQVFYQRASSNFSSGTSFRKLFLSNLSFLLLLAGLGFPAIYLFADYLYPLVFGEAWSMAGLIAEYYVFAAALAFISVPFERSAVIVNAWWYAPGWYIIRVITTLLVIYLDYFYQGTFFDFIFWLTVQVALLHLFDVFASYLFSSKVQCF